MICFVLNFLKLERPSDGPNPGPSSTESDEPAMFTKAGLCDSFSELHGPCWGILL